MTNKTEQRSEAPDAYLIEYREITEDGTNRHVMSASLEACAPTIFVEEKVESRELLKVTPLYAAQPSAREALLRAVEICTKEVESLGTGPEMSSERGAILIVRDAIDALAEQMPQEVAMSDFITEKSRPDCRPGDIFEWMLHLDIHLTEHDDRHASMALRSAWPHIEAYICQLEATVAAIRALAEQVPQRDITRAQDLAARLHAHAEQIRKEGRWFPTTADELDEVGRMLAEQMPQGESAMIDGAWLSTDRRRAFVEGAKWSFYLATKFTMFGSEVDEAEREADKRYGEPPAAAPSQGESADRLRALLQGLECEEIESLMTQRPDVLRAVGVEIAKAARLGAHLYAAAPSQGEGKP